MIGVAPADAPVTPDYRDATLESQTGTGLSGGQLRPLPRAGASRRYLGAVFREEEVPCGWALASARWRQGEGLGIFSLTWCRAIRRGLPCFSGCSRWSPVQ